MISNCCNVESANQSSTQQKKRGSKEMVVLGLYVVGFQVVDGLDAGDKDARPTRSGKLLNNDVGQVELPRCKNWEASNLFPRLVFVAVEARHKVARLLRLT